MFERPHHQRIALVLQSLDSEHRAGQPHKLLANSDRWVDDSVFSRDLIDLAMNAPRQWSGRTSGPCDAGGLWRIEVSADHRGEAPSGRPETLGSPRCLSFDIHGQSSPSG